jgi:putative hydrolase of the HAD superfamily
MAKQSARRASPKIKAILFDLGKVILHFDFAPAFKKLSKASGKTPEQVKNYFLESGLEVLYDGGKISSKRFYAEVKKALGHTLSEAEFRRCWNEIFTPNAETVRLIKKLAKKYRLVLISNTNEMHYEYIRRRYKVLDHFDTLILSFKEKSRKPDHKIYRTAIRACGAKAHEIFYIDDRSDLTEAASELGFHSFTFKNNHGELRRRMAALAIL